MTIVRLATVSLLLASLGCRPAGARAPEQGVDLEALCGSWRTSVERTQVEERWQLVEGGLAGESVTIEGEGREQLTERFAIDVHADRSTYRAHPVGAARETAFEQVEARALEAGAWRWAWSNPAHDFPQRIEYELRDDQLHARILGPAAPGSTQTRSLEWTFERVAPCPTP